MLTSYERHCILMEVYVDRAKSVLYHLKVKILAWKSMGRTYWVGKKFWRCRTVSKSSAKPNIRDTKVMFCIWWQQKDVLYYKLQNSGETVNAERLHYLENSDWEVLPHRPYSTYTATSDYHLLSMQSAHTACDSQQRQYIKDWLDSFLIIMTSQLSQSKPRKSNTALFEILIVYAHIFWRKPWC